MSILEITRRDGLARAGFFRAGERDIPIPSAVEPETVFPALAESRMENVPLSADATFAARYLPPGGLQPVRIHPAVEREVPSGACVMVPCWHTAFSDPRRYVEWIVSLKTRLPP
ncbi:MAG: pseudouridine synthase, partial [Methanolinea sp.]